VPVAQPTPTAPVVIGLPDTGLPALAPGAGLAAALPLRSAGVAANLELRIPALGIDAPVLAVGVTAKGAMDAPMGPLGDPVWQQAFWYMGSGAPGESGVAAIAGHVYGHGKPALFVHLKRLRPGDWIVVRNTRTGQDIRYVVTEKATYTARQASDPAVLARIYGAGPVSGRAAQPSPDGRSYLSLITCTGNIVQGAYDQRLVIYAERVRPLVTRMRAVPK